MRKTSKKYCPKCKSYEKIIVKNGTYRGKQRLKCECGYCFTEQSAKSKREPVFPYKDLKLLSVVLYFAGFKVEDIYQYVIRPNSKKIKTSKVIYQWAKNYNYSKSNNCIRVQVLREALFKERASLLQTITRTLMSSREVFIAVIPLHTTCKKRTVYRRELQIPKIQIVTNTPNKIAFQNLAEKDILSLFFRVLKMVNPKKITDVFEFNSIDYSFSEYNPVQYSYEKFLEEVEVYDNDDVTNKTLECYFNDRRQVKNLFVIQSDSELNEVNFYLINKKVY